MNANNEIIFSFAIIRNFMTYSKIFFRQLALLKLESVFICILFILRIIELVGLKFIIGIEYSIYFLIFRGFLMDVLYLLALSLFFMLLNSYSDKFSQTFTRIYKVFVISIIFLYFLNILYFIFTGTPLDQSIFIHSFSDISMAISKSLNHPLLLFMFSLIIFISLIYSLLWLFKRVEISFLLKKIIFWISIASPLAIVVAKPQQVNFSREIEYQIVENKLVDFLHSSYDYWINNLIYSKNEFDNLDIKAFQNDIGNWEFVDNDFPLLHIDNEQDVIGKYFQTDGVKPNYVFIICESLSRAFSGEDSYFGSFTPFLDSLEKNGLYWENCLSSTERTFGAIPAIIGSLPYAKTGFAGMAGDYPKHLTLMSLMKRNGYFTSYFHGGPLGFDNLYDFIKFQQPNFIYNESTANPIADNADNKDVSWGMYDDELFRQSIKTMLVQNTKKPRFDLFLTLTTHEPFNIPDRKYWEAQFDKRLEFLNLNSQQKQLAKAQKLRLSSFMYLDNSIRQFMLDYKKNFDFKHTIFVITGDHRMGTITRNDLEKYHVPLIIYSPMIVKPQKFKAVASHLAIAPTINSFMKHNYEYKSPDTVSWFSHSLDTYPKFRNTFSFPTMRNSREIEEYIYQNYYLYKDKLFKIEENLDIKQIVNDNLKNLIVSKMKRYMKYNYYMCYNDRIFPYNILPQNIINQLLINNSWKELLKVNSEKEYTSICDKYAFEKSKYKNIMFQMEFDFMSRKHSGDSLPLVVMTLENKAGENIIWKAFNLTNIDGSNIVKTKNVHINIEYNIDLNRYKIEDKTYLKVYYWNNKKVEYQVENFNFKLFGIK
ncbi:MAG: hypothetical protein AUJ98_00590 [Bacteroidetes bacterium CG2_30_33_31]|nr:MAG: hypothetical protein AUJ98_00590 [Bacteroidetes bacterium CG2_30_33_31]